MDGWMDAQACVQHSNTTWLMLVSPLPAVKTFHKVSSSTGFNPVPNIDLTLDLIPNTHFVQLRTTNQIAGLLA